MDITLDIGTVSAPSDFDTFGAQLHALARRIECGDEQAPVDLHRLLVRLQQHGDARCTGLYVFASALAQRVSGAMAQSANLYLRRFEVPQIELFNLLGRCLPLARMATQAANTAIAAALRGQAHPTLLDIGIGTGRQTLALLEQLAAAGELPQALTVIGVEPGAAALAEAREALTQTARRLGVRLSFHGFEACAETLRASEWARIRHLCTGRPIVNAAFALHHIADDAEGRDQRGHVLNRLRALEPSALVLIEPDVDHLEARLGRRFANCFAHFGAVFQLLDALPLAQADRDALKVGFFGREIHDVLGTPERLRSERHETAGAWLRRLALAGFVAQDPAQHLVPALHRCSHSAVRLQRHPMHVALAVGPVPVLSLMVATPAIVAA